MIDTWFKQRSVYGICCLLSFVINIFFSILGLLVVFALEISIPGGLFILASACINSIFTPFTILCGGFALFDTRHQHHDKKDFEIIIALYLSIPFSLIFWMAIIEKFGNDVSW